MTKLLEEAISKVRELPEGEQDEAAAFLLMLAARRAEPEHLDEDTRVAIEEWLYRALRRAGREAEARALLARVPSNLSVSTNAAYYRALLTRRNEWPADDLLDPLPVEGRFETRAYGLAVDALLANDRERAQFLLRRIAQDAHWPGFGRIAAEADLARMR